MLIKNRSDNCTLVFLPGFLGFHQYGFAGFEISYFKNLKTRLQNEGVSFLFPSTLKTATVAERAEHFSREIMQSANEKFILIGHSMGGLDGRFAIHHLDPDHRVRALVTLATPHHGTPLASWILESNGPLQNLFRFIGANGLRDLTPEACLKRNQELIDRQDVSYISYTGKRAIRDMPRFLRPLGRMVEKAEGDNDCLVSVSSAKWGDFRGTVPADHFEIVGWNLGSRKARIKRPFGHIEFFARILNDVLETVGE